MSADVEDDLSWQKIHSDKEARFHIVSQDFWNQSYSQSAFIPKFGKKQQKQESQWHNNIEAGWLNKTPTFMSPTRHMTHKQPMKCAVQGNPAPPPKEHYVHYTEMSHKALSDISCPLKWSTMTDRWASLGVCVCYSLFLHFKHLWVHSRHLL